MGLDWGERWADNGRVETFVVQLEAIAVEQEKLAEGIRALQGSAGALEAANVVLTQGNAVLTQKVADLTAQLTAAGSITAQLQAALDRTAAASKVNADLLGGGAPPVDQPGIYLRPVVATPAGSYRQWTNEGLGVWSQEPGDFSSSQAQVVYEPDGMLAVDKTVEPWWVQNIGVLLAEVENMSNGSFSGAPLLYQDPDPAAAGWVEYNTEQHEQLGRPIGVARGYGRWSNTGFVLFSKGYVGTAGTVTAKSPWSGILLPANKVPSAICVTSGSELVLVTVVDTDTGKGELAVIAAWGGQDLQAAAGSAPFGHDWAQAHPLLGHPAVVCGMKILGYVDLGIAAPSGVSAIGSPTSSRVANKTDGNAGSLGEYDLNQQADRDAFNYRKGGVNQWMNSVWGFAVVISKTEHKAVWVSFDEFFAGVYEQYFTTQALYDATKPSNPLGAWWARFGSGDVEWPYTFAGKPAWTPKVVATVDVPGPTSVLLSENDQVQDNSVAIGCADGVLQFFHQRPPVEIGELRLGNDLTCLTYDKFPSQTGTRRGGFIAVSRGDKAIYFIDKWGAGATVTKILKDPRLIDPVHAEVADTHALDGGVLSVCDHEGRQVLNYRYTKLTLTNYANQEFGMGLDGKADFECTGILKIPGKPIAVCGTNVN